MINKILEKIKNWFLIKDKNNTDNFCVISKKDVKEIENNIENGILKNKKIIDICESLFEKHKNYCNFYVIEVAKKFGIELVGQANDIIDQIQCEPWVILKDGIEANKKAKEGYFIIGGVKDSPNGHIVIVTGGDVLAHGKYPLCYCGSMAGWFCRNQTLNNTFLKKDRDNVVYGCIKIG